MASDAFGLTAGCRFSRGTRRAREAEAVPVRTAALSPLDFFGAQTEPPDQPEQLLVHGRQTKLLSSHAEQVHGQGRPAKGRATDGRPEKGRADNRRATYEGLADEPPAKGQPASSSASLTPRQVAEANQLRKALRIHAYGNELPPPVQSAHELSEKYAMRPFLYRNIMTAGYHELTRVQMQAIPALLGGRELLACAPTGSGKTAAFVIPMLQHLTITGSSRKRSGSGPRAVLVAPTQELARQTHREVLKLAQGGKLKAALLTRKMVTGAQAEERGGSYSGGGAASLTRYDIMVSTPLRLVGLINKGLLPMEHVTMLVLDEADKLLDLGFLEQVDTLLGACTHKSVTRALFSATMMPTIEQLADTVLRQPVRVVVGEKNAAAETVEQSLLFVGREDGKILALRQMIKQGIKPPVLVFVQSKERAVQLFHQLVLDGIRVDVIHADRSQAQRDHIVDQFRLGKVWVLIATELMARGMDFKGVQLVINFDFPQTTVSYIHRIGRTGRAGMMGRAVTFFTEEDVEQLRSIANVMKASGCPVPDWMLRLQPMRKKKRKQLAEKPRARKAIFKKQRTLPASSDRGDGAMRDGEVGGSPQRGPRKLALPKRPGDKAKGSFSTMSRKKAD